MEDLLERMRKIDTRVSQPDGLPSLSPITSVDQLHVIGEANPGLVGTDLEDLLQRIEKLEALVGGKVDCDTFDNELMSIREMIGNFEPSGGDENTKLAITTVVSAPSKERGP